MKKIYLSFFILIQIVDCLSQTDYKYEVPAKLSDGWEVEDMKDVINKSDTMHFFLSAMEKAQRKHKIHSFLLVQNGRLVIDEYYGHYNPNKTHDLRSATKSITSLLVGKAISLGFIKSVNDPISNYINKSQYPKANKEALNEISIAHLLTMSSGLACNDWDKKSPGQEDKMYKKKDWLKHFLRLDMINEPGDSALYCTGGVVLLGEIIAKTSGMKFDKFAEKYLFTPLNITDYQWQYYDNNAKTDSGGHLYLKPRDLAKIGQLIIQKGQWNGDQLIPESWVNEAISVKTRLGGFYYGYLWWKFDMPVGDEMTPINFASGNGGQLIFIIPAFNTVCIFTGGNYNSDRAKTPFYLLKNNILPLLKPSINTN